MTDNNFEAVIGLEIHAQVASKSKMFCKCSSDAFNAEPNQNTCPICMGFPGQLPVTNIEAVNKGIQASLALKCVVPEYSKFDRKNYFYPDLPKGYQISQFDEPLAVNGKIDININNELKTIRITRLHLEDDAGKLTHVKNGTLCDYNRSGIPLMEIVSEPDIKSAEEAGTYARAMQSILRYVDASHADMEKGMMRFDASVSIRKKGENVLNKRAEIKNLNSFKSLEAAIDYEISRQIELYEESGRPLEKDITVGWNDSKQKTYFMREKEGSDDYRYFPEPDLPPVIVKSDFIDKIKTSLPELPHEKKQRYIADIGMSEADAALLSADKNMATFYEEVAKNTGEEKKTSSFIANIVVALLNKNGVNIENCKLNAESLAKLLNMVYEGKISMNTAKGEVIEEMFETGSDPEKIVEEKSLSQMSDTGELEQICDDVVKENVNVIEDYKNGKEQAFFFLVGQVMKKTKGQANAKVAQEILKKLIS
ncbi:Asp-tRNA(Asn)/Glu-tRNA(Gln) amidotransferase subunit GatB [Candidatus Peregrinibacteria bacterium]|nr:Asp-tRNA(Asn)/Glu-tRNA(Gln) amidotransferase subunit GatB [Candidatus Peregrinibacteria bacterium]